MWSQQLLNNRAVCSCCHQSRKQIWKACWPQRWTLSPWHRFADQSCKVKICAARSSDQKVLISGGPEKVGIMLATLTSLSPSVLITDEVTATRLLEADSAR